MLPAGAADRQSDSHIDQASQESALGPQQLFLSFPCLLESRDLSPSQGFDCHLYISPKPKAKFTIFSQNQHAHPPAGLISVTCTIILLLGQLQIPVSFLTPFSLPFFINQPQTLSQYLIPLLIMSYLAVAKCSELI